MRGKLFASVLAGMSFATLAFPADTPAAEGTELRTISSPADLHLQSGVDVRLSSRSAGAVFSDHLILQEGAVHVGNFSGYTVNAGSIQIESNDPAAEAVVRLTSKTVEVASLGGTVSVSDGGAMLTHVTAGTRMSFQQSAAAPAATQSGVAPGPRHKLPSDRSALYWAIIISAAAGLAIGITAWTQGKSPF